MYDIIKIDKKIIDCTNDFKQDNNYFKNISNDILDFTYNNSSSKELSL